MMFLTLAAIRATKPLSELLNVRSSVMRVRYLELPSLMPRSYVSQTRPSGSFHLKVPVFGAIETSRQRSGSFPLARIGLVPNRMSLMPNPLSSSTAASLVADAARSTSTCSASTRTMLSPRPSRRTHVPLIPIGNESLETVVFRNSRPNTRDAESFTSSCISIGNVPFNSASARKVRMGIAAVITASIESVPARKRETRIRIGHVFRTSGMFSHPLGSTMSSESSTVRFSASLKNAFAKVSPGLKRKTRPLRYVHKLSGPYTRSGGPKRM